MDLVQFGDVLIEYDLSDGYIITHSKFTIMDIVSFWKNNERLPISFIKHYGQCEPRHDYAEYIGHLRKSKEWFVERLMEHPPLFVWFLFHQEIFE